MKFLTVLILQLLLVIPTFAKKTVTIIGHVYDQDLKPLKDARVSIWLGGGRDSDTITGADGSFFFHDIDSDSYYLVSSRRAGYLNKTTLLRPDKSNFKDTLFVSITLRDRKLAVINTASIGKRDLGMRISKALKKYKIDTTECHITDEPPGIARGIVAELGDSVVLYLQIERTSFFTLQSSWKRSFKNILRKKVIGIGLAYPNCKTIYYGHGFIWSGIHNPYCKQKHR